MVNLVVLLDIVPGERQRFLAAMESNARASRMEPGCRGFDVIQDAADPDRFVLYETYVDEAAIDAHRRTPHFAVWQAEEPACVRNKVIVRGRPLRRGAESGRDAPGTAAEGDVSCSCLLVRSAGIAPFDRGAGVVTFPYVGSWNCDANGVTTGRTLFAPGTGLPLHTHNVEESVLILRGDATAVLGEETVELTQGDATWVPRDVPHRFVNRGASPMEIYWVYGGRDVTRTICATGETFAHLSEHDRGAVRERMDGSS